MVPHVKTAWVDISVNAPVDSKENAVMKVTKKIKNKKNWKRNVTLFISSILIGSLVRRNCSFSMRIFIGSRNWEDTGLLLQISVNLSNSRLQQSLWDPKRHRGDWETDRQSNSNNNNNENNKTCINFNASDKFYHVSLFFEKIYLFILIQFWSFNAWMWLTYIFTCIPLRPSDVDECSANTKCKNGATCVNTIGAYQCLCSRGYQGKHCDQGLNFVITNGPVIFRSPGGILGVSHSLQGEHNKDQPSLKDYIYRVYWGKGSLEFYRALRWDKVNFILTYIISSDVDECANSPCKNGGSCMNLRGSYRCDCIKGFTGKHCEQGVLAILNKFFVYTDIHSTVLQTTVT